MPDGALFDLHGSDRGRLGLCSGDPRRVRQPDPVFYPVMLAIPIAVKWLVIGALETGRLSPLGPLLLPLVPATTIEAAVPVGYLAGTPLLNIYLRLIFPKIGSNVHLDSFSFAIYDLLAIGVGFEH